MLGRTPQGIESDFVPGSPEGGRSAKETWRLTQMDLERRIGQHGPPSHLSL